MRILLYLTAAVLLVMAGGCGGSDSSDSEAETAPTVNFRVADIEQPEADANAGHSINVEYTVESDGIASNVIVNFYMVNSDQFTAQEDNETEPMSEQYYLGTDVIEAVVNGTNHLSAEFIIPDSVNTEGGYFIIAHLDPDDLLSETNEDDNIYSTNEARGRAPSVLLDISTDYTDVTNFILKDFVLEDASIILDNDDLAALAPSMVDLTVEYPAHGAAHLSGHALVRVEGKLPTIEELQAIKVKAQINIGGVWTDIYSWNYDLGRYGDYVTLQVDAAEPLELEADEIEDRGFEEFIINVDASIPAAAALAMLNEIVADVTASPLSNYNKFDFRLVIDSDNAVAELNENDNTVALPVTVYSFPNLARSGSDYLMEKEYNKGIGNKKKVKVELDTYFKNGLENGPKYGAIAKNEFELKAYAFKKSTVMFGIQDIKSAYVNSPGDTGYFSEIEMFGDIVYGEEQWADELTLAYERDWSLEKKIASADFMIGPVPLTAETGADGQFGILFSSTLSINPANPILSSDNHLPDLDIDLYVSAGVGNSIFSAGPIATLVILDELLRIRGSVDVVYNNVLNDMTAANLNLNVTNDMKSIQGKFGLYVKYKTLKWCKKWGVKYPCGTQKKKKTKYFYKTDALYDKKATLYNKTKAYIIND